MAITSQQLDRQRKRKNAPGQGRKPEQGYHATIKVRFENEDDLAFVIEYADDLLARGKALKALARRGAASQRTRARPTP